MANNSKYYRIFILIAVILVPILVVSACDYLGISGDSSPERPENTRVITPGNNSRVVVGSPIQIQSAHANPEIARVELRVLAPNQPAEQLLTRSNVPDNGIVLQQWTPAQVGMHTIRLVAYNANNQPIDESLTLQIEVIDDAFVSGGPAAAPPAQPQPDEESAVFQPPTPTVPPVEPPQEEVSQQEVVMAVAATPEAIAVATPTAIPHYPPPPPIPGVPPGPTQDQLPELMPPVCDAAQYIGPFVPNTAERITITEPDDVPARTVGGTLVHRAWRLQNIGTCTWGPGYELAFYGGRAMGSGGVAFDAFFPDEPDRKNLVIDQDRLVAPEGKPNQVAVLEVLLQAPVTPGIHQSYWRMRNPHGVYFGPIIGVTLEVVRECKFGIYGAPVINRFEILGVGDVFRPTDPVNVRAERGEPVTLDWSIINADGYDIVVRDPVGNTANLSTNNRTDRNSFIPSRVGQYVITLYADNGPCTATASVNVDVFPPEGEQFNLIVLTAGATSAVSASDTSLRTSPVVLAGNVKVEWQHFDQNTDEFILYSELYERKDTESCYDLFGYRPCFTSRGDWRLVDSIQTRVGGAGDAQGAATITNVESVLCGKLSGPDVEHQIRYVLQARKNGRPAAPEFSNVVIDAERPCGGSSPIREISPSQ